MTAATACRICGGPLELLASGDAVALAPQSFTPTCHRPGAHGDLYRCRRCGAVEQPSLPRGEALHEPYRRMSDEDYLARERGRPPPAARLLARRGDPRGPGRAIVADRPSVRSFPPAYWLGGLADRSAAVGAMRGLVSRLPRRTLLSLSLGDERVLVARRGAVDAARAGGRARAEPAARR